MDEKDQAFHPATAFSGIQEFEEKLLDMHYPHGAFPLLDNVLQNQKTVFCPLTSPEISPDQWKDLVCFPSLDWDSLSGIQSFDWIIGFPLTVQGEIYGVLVARDSGASPAFRKNGLKLSLVCSTNRFSHSKRKIQSRNG